MEFAAISASNYSTQDLTELLNRGFEEYPIHIRFNPAMFGNMVSQDGIDLTSSRLLIVNDRPSGIALIARRDSAGVSRLAAMGIAKEERGKGAGSWFMGELIEQARQRGEHQMELEVIEHNEPAVKLYRRWGFRTVRKLIGFIRKDAAESVRSQIHEIELPLVARLISQHGLPDLPWQLSGASIAHMTPPARAYRAERAYLVISNPEAEQVVIWSLLVEPGARGSSQGSALLKSVIAHHPGKTWRMPAILPEEFGKVFERAGFEREELSQWQMKLDL